MPANVYDQAGRFAVGLDPGGFLGWALGLPPGAVGFAGWVDTRGVPFPGSADRTGDRVARLDAPPDGTPWAVAVEFQFEPDPVMFGRLLGYLGQLWVDRKPDPERGSRFQLGAVVVNLTGRGSASRDMAWPGAGLHTRLSVAERNLGAESADELVRQMERGDVSPGLLPWVPLTAGGGDPDILRRWKVLAEAEPDFRRRGEYGGLARVFAAAAGRQGVWDQALEGWNVYVNPVVEEWRAEGRAEGEARGLAAGRAAAVLETLEARFGAVPADLAAAVRGVTDPARMAGWAGRAATAPSVDAFRHAAGV